MTSPAVSAPHFGQYARPGSISGSPETGGLAEPVSTSRLNGDTRKAVQVVTWAVGLLAVAAFSAGVPGLVAVGQWAQLGALAFLTPLIIDLSIALFAVVGIVKRSRRESAVAAMGWVAGMTVLSAGLQISHTLLASPAIDWQALVGSATAASAPILLFASSHFLLDIAFAPAPKAAKRAPAKQTAKAQQVTRPRVTASVAAQIVAAPRAQRPPQAVTAPFTSNEKAAKEALFDAAVARVLAGESDRTVAAELGLARSTVQSRVKKAVEL